MVWYRTILQTYVKLTIGGTYIIFNNPLAAITVPRDVEFTFSQASYNIQEGAGFVTVTVDLLTGSPSRQTVLTISTDDLTATGKLLSLYLCQTKY